MVTRYQNRNDAYLRRNLKRLMARFGGKWIVVSGGRPAWIGPKKSLKRHFEMAKKKHPREIPLVSPIPTKEQVHCILSSSHTKK
jgi:hypothetical protein